MADKIAVIASENSSARKQPSPSGARSTSGRAAAGSAVAGIIQRIQVSPGLVSPAEMFALQRTAGNRAVNQLLRTYATGAPATTAARRTPLQRADAPASAAPTDPVLHAVFQASVAGPIRNAGTLLSQPKPNARGALDQLTAAGRTTETMIDPLSAQGNEVAAEGTSALFNAIGALVAQLVPHLRAPFPLSQIAGDIAATEPRIARVDSEISGAASPPAPSSAASAPSAADTADVSGDSPAPAAPTNPVLHAAFQASVAGPIRNAGALLRQPQPDVQGAVSQLKAANVTAATMVDPLRAQGNDVAAEGTSALFNSVSISVEELAPHLGITQSLSAIGANIAAVEPRIARVDSEISGSASVPTPALPAVPTPAPAPAPAAPDQAGLDSGDVSGDIPAPAPDPAPSTQTADDDTAGS